MIVAYKLGKKEPASDGIKRIIAELLQDSLRMARRKTGFGDETVHTVRKQLKQVRAAIRLVRTDLGENLFRQENATFRNATRPLSEIRDGVVMIETLDKLLRHSSRKVRPEAFRPLRDALSERRDRIRRAALGPQHAMERAEATLHEALARAKRWPIGHNGWKAVKSGLRKSYKQGREAMAEALRDGSDEAMHEWRKRLKYQRHHLEILRNIRKEVMEPLVRQAQRLADLLGEHHDLAVLKNLVDGELSASLGKKQREMLLALLAERQQCLQRKAAKLGRRLCAEGEDKFIARIHRYWRAWR